MRVLLACEESGECRNAFTALGHDAWSCDLLPSAQAGNHFQLDIETVLYADWDLVIAFPPCTHLCSSGAKWFADKRKNGEQRQAIKFFLTFTKLNCPWAIENPVGIMSTVYRKPNQIIQPWFFGHSETKATCLWLNKLPLLKPTNVTSETEKRIDRIHKMPPSPKRSKLRSRTYHGIAQAMATQWGGLRTP